MSKYHNQTLSVKHKEAKNHGGIDGSEKISGILLGWTQANWLPRRGNTPGYTPGPPHPSLKGYGRQEKNLDKVPRVVVKRIILFRKRDYGRNASFQLVVVARSKERRGLPVNRP
jgi:hypothetical protein